MRQDIRELLTIVADYTFILFHCTPAHGLFFTEVTYFKLWMKAWGE